MKQDLIIPNNFLQNKDLNLFECAVLACIKASMDSDCNTIISDSDIAAYLQINVISLPNAFSKFIKLGYIEKTTEGGKRIITYTYDAPHRAAGKVGFIYIMQDTTNHFIKIGYSNSPKYRESTLQAEKPTIELVKYFRGSMAQEQQVHRILAKYRIRGEWFQVTTEQAEEAIKRVIGL
jgi:hypothetical protein